MNQKIQSPIHNASVSQMIKLCYRNAFNYKGRSTKEERIGFIPSSIYGCLVFIYSIAAVFNPVLLKLFPVILILLPIFLLPWISYIVRRLHDVGKSAGHLIFLLVPLYGVFYIFYELSRNSDNNLNKWGYPCSQEKMACGYRV